MIDKNPSPPPPIVGGLVRKPSIQGKTLRGRCRPVLGLIQLVALTNHARNIVNGWPVSAVRWEVVSVFLVIRRFLIQYINMFCLYLHVFFTQAYRGCQPTDQEEAQD